ncbi:MAG TPA: site-2 protease family protein [Acidobacteriaceae bacterium]|jgi:Zn-dependent protease|nr:site-2 protease family protein [Acidobacteriaceae bacterium]
MNRSQGAIRLGRIAGIELYLHWSWFLVAAIEIESRGSSYTSISWNILEYLALFLIVTLHEFGHALACRQVGGTADRILLWPLGGVAYVNPPPRPGATLWSIAAGPLVNVALLPVLMGLAAHGQALGWAQTMPNANAFLHAIVYINLGLLLFNLVPVYPLDGGQILRSLLWFVLGRARSLLVSTVLGFAGAAAFVAFALWSRSLWFGLLAAFFVYSCWRGFGQARILRQMEKLPRREEWRCPFCKTAPPAADLWICRRCGGRYDTFATLGVCPTCGSESALTACPECGRMSPIGEWQVPVALPEADIERRSHDRINSNG